jgi:hypothetical protein
MSTNQAKQGLLVNQPSKVKDSRQPSQVRGSIFGLLGGWTHRYPRLSRMAIDLFSIPAMSSEPERIFSLAGHMVTVQRGRLQADIIGAAQCISSWERSGAIQITK